VRFFNELFKIKDLDQDMTKVFLYHFIFNEKLSSSPTYLSKTKFGSVPVCSNLLETIIFSYEEKAFVTNVIKVEEF